MRVIAVSKKKAPNPDKPYLYKGNWVDKDTAKRVVKQVK